MSLLLGSGLTLFSAHVFSQGINGCVPSLYHSRERRAEVIVRGAVVSEKEALLLGKYNCYIEYH